ncbi:MAG: hypothetical protein QW404_01705 [Candidatus Nanoarchaeia archaeon]
MKNIESTTNEELEKTYEIEGNELTIMKMWEYSKKLGNKDWLLVNQCLFSREENKTEKMNIALNKEDLCEMLKIMPLPKKYDMYKELKARLYHFIEWGMPFQVEDMLREIKEFKEKYLLPKNELNREP